MGLTGSSTGFKAASGELIIKKRTPKDKIIALGGNPNVGKSTLFNSLTGLKQHTGNWPGKTVSNAQGYCKTKKSSFVFVDIPGTYSLFAHSPEEEIARNFICFGGADKVVIVCDATCLERSLNLCLQTLEITKNVVICVNLLDEAKRKGIEIDLDALSKRLGVSVVGTVARKKKSLEKLLFELEKDEIKTAPYSVIYQPEIEEAIALIEPALNKNLGEKLNNRWLSLRLLEPNNSFLKEIEKFYGFDILSLKEIEVAVSKAKALLESYSISLERLKDMIASSIVSNAEILSQGIVSSSKGYSKTDRKIDKLLTNKFSGYLVMLLLLCFIFWLTITGANYISSFLSDILFKLEAILNNWLIELNCADFLRRLLIEGVYRVPAWVISVMLPPMAIFFPLFTLLEDAGYLPRVAFNLDKPFKRCKGCGKQALTMCMGFGCNAAGIIGCRIIDSPRERMLAIITNSLVPCNGRFPAIITLISIFFVSGKLSSVYSALFLTLVILLGIFATFLSTRLLSATVLKGSPSSYTIEMPPYRKPQITQVLIRSVLDRTLFVLGRSVAVAVPAGIIIWLMANIIIEDKSLLIHCAEFLEPIAQLIGLDGVILIAFILGFPANEIVIPIALMAYLKGSSLTEFSSLSQMQEILVSNGWTHITAVCTIIFSLFHWPCSTTVLTIKKETGSLKWALFSMLFPTALGLVTCFIINLVSKLFI